jgi:hypothetical protein
VLSRRDTLKALAAAGVATPALAACGDAAPAAPRGPQAGAGPVRLVSADVARSPGSPRAIPGAVDSMGAFATDLWRRLPADGNLAL